MSHENTNWGQSVTAVVIKDGKVLLARHTYGDGQGKLIVPGGYVQFGETPQNAVKREFLEETKISIEPQNIIAIRFNAHDWYIAFTAEYVGGEAASDHDENDFVVWMDVQEALARTDVPDLTKELIRSACNSQQGLVPIPYEGNSKHGKGYLFGLR